LSFTDPHYKLKWFNPWAAAVLKIKVQNVFYALNSNLKKCNAIHAIQNPTGGRSGTDHKEHRKTCKTATHRVKTGKVIQITKARIRTA
jgi:hypothetical protein